MKHKIKMNIFFLETTVNTRLSTPPGGLYIISNTFFFGGGDFIETEGLFKRGEAYSI